MIPQVNSSNQVMLTAMLPSSDPFSSTVKSLCTALKSGKFEDIQAFEKSFQHLQTQGNMDGDKLVELLTAKDDDEYGRPGLFFALREGHTEALNAWGRVLRLLPANHRDKVFNLLSAKDHRGEPGLMWALEKGHVETMQAWGELLNMLPQDQSDKLFELLSMQSVKEGALLGWGLIGAIENDHAEAMDALGVLLQRLPEEQLNKFFELLIFQGRDGRARMTNALMKAQEKKYISVMKAWGKLLELVPNIQPDKLFKFLNTKDKDGITLLHTAFIRNDQETIEILSKLLKRLDQPDKLVELLAARDEQGIPELFIAGMATKFANGIESAFSQSNFDAYKNLFALLKPLECDRLFDALLAPGITECAKFRQWLTDPYMGRSVVKNYNEFTTFITSCRTEAGKSEVAAKLQAAADYFAVKDYVQAVAIYKDLAKAENPDALFQLFSLHRDKKIQLTEQEVINFLERAHKAGHPRAAFELGNYYLQPQTKNIELARAWFEKAKQYKCHSPFDNVTFSSAKPTASKKN